MFERFTDAARRSVVLAQEEARLLHHNYIGPEHLLLGLVSEGTVAKTVGVPLDALRGRVEREIGRGTGPASEHPAFTVGAKRVLEESLRLALQRGDDFIGPENIMLGLLAEREDAQLLISLGLDPPVLRRVVAGEQVESGAAAASSRTAGWRVVREPVTTPDPSLPVCSFCGRRDQAIKFMVVTANAAICDACLGQCLQLIAESEA